MRRTRAEDVIIHAISPLWRPTTSVQVRLGTMPCEGLDSRYRRYWDCPSRNYRRLRWFHCTVRGWCSSARWGRPEWGGYSQRQASWMLRAARSEGAWGTKQCNENEIKERKADRQERIGIKGGRTGRYKHRRQADEGRVWVSTADVLAIWLSNWGRDRSASGIV